MQRAGEGGVEMGTRSEPRPAASILLPWHVTGRLKCFDEAQGHGLLALKSDCPPRIPGEMGQRLKCQAVSGRKEGLCTSDGSGMDGTVKWFNRAHGYGFVTCIPTGSDFFLHMTTLRRCGLRPLAAGQKVRVQIARSAKGDFVVHIALRDQPC